MNEIEAEVLKQKLFMVMDSLRHILVPTAEAFQASKRITQDEKFAIISWCSAGSEALKDIGMILFPGGEA